MDKSIRIEFMEENKLQVIIEESGLEKSKAQVLLEKFGNYFAIAAEWEKKAQTLVVTDVGQRAEMKMAREARLFLNGKRVDIEKTRKVLKEQSLREGQTIDSIAKILTNLISPIETHLEAQERFAEIQEAKRVAALKLVREAEVLPYIEFLPMVMELGTMSEEDYGKLLNGAKLQKQAKEDEERRMEEERVARLKAELLRRERSAMMNPYNPYIGEAMPDFGTISEERFEELLNAGKAAKLSWEKKQEEIRLENERLRKEKEEADRIHREEMEKMAKERAEAVRLENEARMKLQMQLDAEKEKARKIEEERQKEAQRLEYEIWQEEIRLAREKKAAEMLAKAAAAAPDKEKLLAFADMLEGLKLPETKSPGAIEIMVVASERLMDIVGFIKRRAEQL